MTKKRTPTKAEVQHAVNLILNTEEPMTTTINREAPVRTIISIDPRIAERRRADAVRRSWESRRKLFGPSGYVAGSHPKAGKVGETMRVVYSPEEKKARRADAVKRAWEHRKAAYGSSGYKCGFSPNWVKIAK